MDSQSIDLRAGAGRTLGAGAMKQSASTAAESFVDLLLATAKLASQAPVAADPIPAAPDDHLAAPAAQDSDTGVNTGSARYSMTSWNTPSMPCTST